jgi:hypothetical protein
MWRVQGHCTLGEPEKVIDKTQQCILTVSTGFLAVELGEGTAKLLMANIAVEFTPKVTSNGASAVTPSDSPASQTRQLRMHAVSSFADMLPSRRSMLSMEVGSGAARRLLDGLLPPPTAEPAEPTVPPMAQDEPANPLVLPTEPPAPDEDPVQSGPIDTQSEEQPGSFADEDYASEVPALAPEPEEPLAEPEEALSGPEPQAEFEAGQPAPAQAPPPGAAAVAAPAAETKPMTLLLVAHGSVWLHNVTLQGANDITRKCRGLVLKSFQKVHADGVLPATKQWNQKMTFWLASLMPSVAQAVILRKSFFNSLRLVFGQVLRAPAAMPLANNRSEALCTACESTACTPIRMRSHCLKCRAAFCTSYSGGDVLSPARERQQHACDQCLVYG